MKTKERPSYHLEWTGYATDEAIADYQEQYNDSMDEADKLTLDQARDMMSEDSDYWQNEWQFFVEALTEMMDGREYWRDDASNMGWMSREGVKVFKATNGQQLIEAISPNTDCHYTINTHYSGFKIRISHHDAPMGEYHTIRPINQKTYEINI